jgi:hypothetical protein
VTLAGEGADIMVCDIAEQIGSVPYSLATEADLAETVIGLAWPVRACPAYGQ